MARAKVGIVGAGNVGASLAFLLAKLDICDVVMSDVVDGIPQGKSLDIMQSRTTGYHTSGSIGTTNVEVMNGCQIVVVTAGVPRKPNMTREQLLEINVKIVHEVCSKIKNFQLKPILIIVTNPLDVMTYVALKVTGFQRERVIGMAGTLDSARMAHFIAEKVGVSPKDVQTMVLGSHGDSMVSMPRFTTISGIPISNFLQKEEIDKICARTRDGGAEIVALLKTGSAFYAPANSISILVESILKDESRLFPCSVLLKGEYNLDNVVVGVPIILGESGIKKIIQLELTDDETASLHKSANVVSENIKIVNSMIPV